MCKPKRRSVVAHDLRTPKYRKRVIDDKKRKANRSMCREFVWIGGYRYAQWRIK